MSTPINVFTLGDSRKLSTWSNVPYFLTTTLERKGYRVNRIDIGPDRWLQLGYDLVWRSWCGLAGKRSKHDYFRSRLNGRITRWRIDRALRRHTDGHQVFITFSFGAHRQQRPYVLFCDMTFERSIRYFEGRPADPLEARTVAEEQRNLEAADLVISLFPEQARELEDALGDKVRYYGNVVNMEPTRPDTDQLLRIKMGSRRIVFIGGDKYLPGLERLLDGVGTLQRRTGQLLHLDVIGIRREAVRNAPPQVVFHGYLDKAVAEQRERYYRILENACAFVNPMPKWGAFSASCEAMYLHTPVVLFPYDEFIGTFGTEPTMCEFLQDGSGDDIADALQRLLSDQVRWRRKALAAHEAVRTFTWDAYVDRLVADLEVRPGRTGKA